MTGSIRLTLIGLFTVVVLIFGMVVGRQAFFVGNQEPTPAPDLSDMNVYVYEEPRIIEPFELTDETGETFTEADLKGRWTFAFVGFTNCPDICPTAMSDLRKTGKLLPADMPQPDYLLVSADPERDTPSKLKEYVGFFGPNFHGLTGELSAMRALAKNLGAVIVHRDTEDGVLVDHSAHFALINPDGELAAIFQPPHKPETIVESFREVYQWTRENHPRAAQSQSS